MHPSLRLGCCLRPLFWQGWKSSSSAGSSRSALTHTLGRHPRLSAMASTHKNREHRVTRADLQQAYEPKEAAHRRRGSVSIICRSCGLLEAAAFARLSIAPGLASIACIACCIAGFCIACAPSRVSDIHLYWY